MSCNEMTFVGKYMSCSNKIYFVFTKHKRTEGVTSLLFRLHRNCCTWRNDKRSLLMRIFFAGIFYRVDVIYTFL